LVTFDDIPFLKTGVIFAKRQSLGILPDVKICVYKALKGLASANFRRFKKELLNPCGSAVLELFM